jgi:hypothetical protein
MPSGAPGRRETRATKSIEILRNILKQKLNQNLNDLRLGLSSTTREPERIRSHNNHCSMGSAERAAVEDLTRTIHVHPGGYQGPGLDVVELQEHGAHPVVRGGLVVVPELRFKRRAQAHAFTATPRRCHLPSMHIMFP